mmetsp:Transcript_20454/g.38784  ORF Transcript_20454/g.38784 Transcript_20454/m.38784 type:complete len:120 (-) Transcript_20454:166-525(-)
MGGKLLLKMTTTLTKACLYDNASSIPRREENEDRDSNNDDEVLLETLISSRSHRLETIVEEDEAPGKDSLQNAVMKFASIASLCLVLFWHFLVVAQPQREEEVASFFFLRAHQPTSQGG